MSDDEAYIMAKNWFYDKCHGYPEDIIANLAQLLEEVTA